VNSTVLALDINATKAGVALPTGRLLTLTAPTIHTIKGGRVEIGRRLTWWRAHLHDLFDTYRPDIVAIEDYAPHAIGITGKLRTAEVAGIPRQLAHQHGALLIDNITPSELKRWATGAGNATKDDMVLAATDRGYQPANDDEADAALLRAYVLDAVNTPAHRRRWLLPV
jgi:Holliday junction resolvasome RuvABC endonuclease subunit